MYQNTEDLIKCLERINHLRNIKSLSTVYDDLNEELEASESFVVNTFFNQN